MILGFNVIITIGTATVCLCVCVHVSVRACEGCVCDSACAYTVACVNAYSVCVRGCFLESLLPFLRPCVSVLAHVIYLQEITKLVSHHIVLPHTQGRLTENIPQADFVWASVWNVKCALL